MTPFKMHGTHILSTGSAVPDICISNDLLSNIIDTSDTWISTRTGIKERRILDNNQSIIDLARIASDEALIKGLIKAEDLDLILFATSTPNDLFGSASQLQKSLGATKAAAFDITAACSGFVIGLIVAQQFIQTGTYKNILIVGADTLSQWVDWSDRTTCILFGDGAGAAILQPSRQNDLMSFELNTDGSESHQLSIQHQENSSSIDYKNLNFSAQKISKYKYLTMNGKEVYKFAVSKVPESINKCLQTSQLKTNQITWLLLHQANQRILDTVSQKLQIPTEKVLSNIQCYGNTSAASIPIALNEAFNTGHICHKDIIAIAGFGAGLTWGSILIQWNAIE
uniref:Beta-ketoacyl-[acyl-carrier-protein] synthase III n=1 Tax=Helminthora furcellata TaxID=1884666 RepID=A0A1G4NZH6_9FLOR|nr:Beta-ketoacyl-acyl carrier protein synthase III [Helminthora furcellata]SCW21066.1 Beta-ketoacyl-acyl carrier protein synthase III [Helminthora furcellata]SCW23926.1 Beta-ketoacyl-acyl carrier protein synthase III [Helminthora furcellata]